MFMFPLKDLARKELSNQNLQQLSMLVRANDCWPAHRAGLLRCNFFGQPRSVSKFPPFFIFVGKIVGGVGGEGIYRNQQIFSRIVD